MHRIPRPAPSRRAFSLVEVLVVIVIIAVLIGILIPALSGARTAARRTATLSLMRDVNAASDAFKIDNNRPPGLFSQRELGRATGGTDTRGFTPMENALLELAGGVLDEDDPRMPSNDLDNPVIEVGPFPDGDTSNVFVDIDAVVSSQGGGYLKLGDDTLFPVQGQNTTVDDYDEGGSLIKGMPDVVDPFGQPLMMWVRDGGAPESIREIGDFAQLDFESASDRAAFYLVTNDGYRNAGVNPDIGPMGDGLIDQYRASSIGSFGAAETRLTANLTALLGHPTLIGENNLSLPSTARGEVILISAGPNQVYAERSRKGQEVGEPPELGYGPENFVPEDTLAGDEGMIGVPVDAFDDIITSTGG